MYGISGGPCVSSTAPDAVRGRERILSSKLALYNQFRNAEIAKIPTRDLMSEALTRCPDFSTPESKP